MFRRLAPYTILLACFAVFLSPVWLPWLETIVADRPDLAADRSFGLSAVETTGSIRSNRTRTAELRADSRGHFEVRAMINGHDVGVMIDTGATSVALRFEDATRLGLHTDPEDFKIPIATANGGTKAARVTLQEIRIGNIRVRNVEALIVPPKSLTTNLMGMSFLKRLTKVQIAGSRLVLEE